MGIPRFYRWLRNRYPQIRIDLSDPERLVPSIDHLYLDFNGMVYRCLRDHECFLKNKFDPLTFQDIYTRVVNYMSKIIEKVNPQETIFIAFDGVAPRAKINQSRDRRFRAAKDKEKLQQLLTKLGLADNEHFQDNSISPGTDFLTNFCEFLKERVEILLATEWKDLKVIFSGCKVAGEGEHKIMEFLRMSKAEKVYPESATHCIYSADADVILLSLSLAMPNVCLVREDSMKSSFGFTATTSPRRYSEPQFEYVLIDILKEYFSGEFRECMEALALKDVQPIIDDFILLMAFVGNDFLPVEFCFSLKDVHMEKLFESYKTYLLKSRCFINNHGIIDWPSVKKLLLIAKEFEASMMLEKIRDRSSLEEGRREMEEEEDEIKNFEVVDHRITRGQDYYYQSRFKITRHDKQFVTIIQKYIEGLEFYARYYFIGLPSWTWFYPYHYTPLLTDVYDYIEANDVQVRLELNQPFEPFLALMFMLPQASFHLLPHQISSSLADPTCSLRAPFDYYPTDFVLDKYEKTGYHKRALIPFLDQGSVRDLYSTYLVAGFTPEELKRNAPDQTILMRKGREGVEKIPLSGPLSGQTEAKKLLKMNKQSTRPVFPSLGIFGKYRIDGSGRIVVDRRYVEEGTPNQLVFFNHFLGFIEEKVLCSEEMKAQFQRSYEKVGIVGTCASYFRIKRARIVREANRISYLKTSREVIVPDFAVFKIPNVSYIQKVHQFEIEESVKKGEEVGILKGEHFGAVGTIDSLSGKMAVVRVVQPTCKTQDRIQENDELFYSLRSVAQELEINQQVLLAVLDEVILLPKSNKSEDNDIYPTGLNFGLSVISHREGLLLPHYARCQMEHENTRDPQSIFEKVELSGKCKSMVQRYLQKFGWLVEYLEERIGENNFNFRKGIYARQLFKNENVNLSLYREFLRKYEVSVEGYFYSIYSKVSSHIPAVTSSIDLSSAFTLSLPISDLLTRAQARIAPPALRSEPEFHDIGDKVFILKSFRSGFIVGIDDSNLFIQTPEGLVRTSFLGVFNCKWGHYILGETGKPWNMDVSYYSPQHYTKTAE